MHKNRYFWEKKKVIVKTTPGLGGIRQGSILKQRLTIL